MSSKSAARKVELEAALWLAVQQVQNTAFRQVLSP